VTSQRIHPDPAPVPRPWETARDSRLPTGKPNHRARRPRVSEGRRQTPLDREQSGCPGQTLRTGRRSHLARLNHNHQEVPR